MNIRCPQCQTTFRVDPSRIPPQGARARCARCGNKFTIHPPGPGATPSAAPAGAPAGAAPPSRPIAAATTAPPPPTPPSFQTPHAPSAAHAPAGHAANPHAGSPASAGAAVAQRERASTSAPASTAGSAPLGARDPNARAERLARALVSDIVAYHPERRDRSLAEGSLRTEFRDEILKSWEEYVAQVGISLAKSTPFFREALNTILAKGQQLF